MFYISAANHIVLDKIVNASDNWKIYIVFYF